MCVLLSVASAALERDWSLAVTSRPGRTSRPPRHTVTMITRLEIGPHDSDKIILRLLTILQHVNYWYFVPLLVIVMFHDTFSYEIFPANDISMS